MRMVCVGAARGAMIHEFRAAPSPLAVIPRNGKWPRTKAHHALRGPLSGGRRDGRSAAGSPAFLPEGKDRVQINVSARHGQLSGATQSKIAAKVSRLKRYFNRLTALNVTVDLENEALPEVEIIASAEHFHDMVSREHSSQLWRSVDGAVQKLEQQLRKHKEKVLDHKHVQPTRES
ncbi:MAG: ribosome-associated translation inhibitor RaiA [Planctomycetia bacterium]|nr:ribosome-associated translation inhibitor RaiA [Planctomycetia bacterium]